MSDYHECRKCSALFRSPKELDDHIDEFQAQRVYHLREADRCSGHSRVNDTDDNLLLQTESSSHRTRSCPHEECRSKRPYSSRQALQRHYLEHVICKEVCVGCHKTFGIASQFPTVPCVKRRKNAI
ncbi:hypothetical protein B0I35DRAFT_178177 [Stachybotrys elegans]|uniref:Uncharacterized protein n=1 Tax=Stachybotrys elegans TaxID=80388 RepID=A0A8K0SDA2_9HYPO|nr:hypothetical protein B0I35DRAFT_178177 [Stachybotrys elegans]